MTGDERVQDLLATNERLLWSGPRWRGPLDYLRQRPLPLLAAAALLVRGALLRVPRLLGTSPGSWIDAYTPLDVAAVLAAAWFAYEVIALRAIHHFVTDRRVGLTHLGGATWREGHPAHEVRRRRGSVILDWGRGPNRMQLGGEPLAEPVTGNLRFRLTPDEVPIVAAQLSREHGE